MSRRPAPPRARRPAAAPPVAPRPASGRGTGAARGGAQRAASSHPASRGRRRTREHDLPGTARVLSVRALVMGVVLLVAFAMVFPTVRAYLGQQARLDALAADVAAAEAREAELQAELDRWDDDAYVVAQARSRLSYVFPGETAYRVIDPEVVQEEPVVEQEAGATSGTALPVGGAVAPWYSTIWQSVQLAGEADVDAEATP